jgi:hypothetical protein
MIRILNSRPGSGLMILTWIFFGALAPPWGTLTSRAGLSVAANPPQSAKESMDNLNELAAAAPSSEAASQAYAQAFVDFARRVEIGEAEAAFLYEHLAKTESMLPAEIHARMSAALTDAKFTTQGAGSMIERLRGELTANGAQKGLVGRLGAALAANPSVSHRKTKLGLLFDKFEGVASTMEARRARLLFAKALVQASGGYPSESVVEVIWRSAISHDRHLQQEAAEALAGLPHKPRYSEWVLNSLRSNPPSQVSLETLCGLMERWEMFQPGNQDALVSAVRYRSGDPHLGKVFGLLRKFRPIQATLDAVYAWLDLRGVPVEEGLALLDHYQVADTRAVARALRSFDTRADTVSDAAYNLILRSGRKVSDEQWNALLGHAFGPRPQAALRAAQLLKKLDTKRLEAFLIDRLKKGSSGEKVRVGDIVARFGPWNEEFDKTVDKLSLGDRRLEARAARLLLAKSSRTQVVDELLSGLNDPDPAIRVSAAKELGAHADDPEVIRRLADRLIVEDERVGQRLVRLTPWLRKKALADWKATSAAIVESLRKGGSSDPEVHKALLRSLFARESKADRAALNSLIHELKLHPEAQELLLDTLRQGKAFDAAFEAIAGMKPVSAEFSQDLVEIYFDLDAGRAPDLFAHLDEHGFGPALSARIEQVLEIGTTQARLRAAEVPVLKKDVGGDVFSRALQREKDEKVREALKKAIVQRGPDSLVTRAALLDMVVGGSDVLAWQAYKALTADPQRTVARVKGRVDRNLVFKLVEILKSGAEERRDMAADLVRYADGITAAQVAELLDLVPELDGKLAAMLIDSLSGHSEHSKILAASAVSHLKSNSPNVRRAAARTLSSYGKDDSAAQAALIARLKTEKVSDVSSEIWKALDGKLLAQEFPETASVLLESYRKIESVVSFDSSNAVRVMSEWSEVSPELVSTLQGLSGHKVPKVGAAAKTALTRISTENPEFLMGSESVALVPVEAGCIVNGTKTLGEKLRFWRKPATRR